MQYPHREFGIPDEFVELISPPPFESQEEARNFFRTIAQLAAALPPRDGLDWISLSDAAYDRTEIQAGRVAKHTVRVLHYDRAYREIARPGGVRFVEYNPFKPANRMLAHTVDYIEAEQDEEEFEKAVQQLHELQLSEEPSVAGVALVLAGPVLQALEDLEQARRNSQRAALLDVERRAQRRAPTTHVEETVIDSEVGEDASTVTSEDLREDAELSKAPASPPADPAQPELFAAE